MAPIRANIGQSSVHGVWSYQGSKPFVDHGRVYASMGNTVICTDAATGKVLWSRAFGDKTRALLDSALTPPSIVNGKVFVGSSTGAVYALSEMTGDVLWKVDVGEAVVFQPAVVGGRVYVATGNGSIYALNTLDARDDGWRMWGGTSLHNGL